MELRLGVGGRYVTLPYKMCHTIFQINVSTKVINFIRKEKYVSNVTDIINIRILPIVIIISQLKCIKKKYRYRHQLQHLTKSSKCKTKTK